MVKIYKRPFKSVLSFSAFIAMLVFILSLAFICRYVVLPFVVTGDFVFLGMRAILLLLLFPVWYICIGKYFYIILDEDRITVKNYFLPFLRIRWYYKDIRKVRFWLPYPRNALGETVEIVKRGRKWGSWSYGILMVDPLDYPEMVSILESKGLKVDTYRNLTYKQYMEIDREIRKGLL